MTSHPKAGRGGRHLADTDRLLDDILVDAHGDDEQLWALRQAFEDNVPVPCDGFVVGEPVSIVGFDYDGNTRRGLTARCRPADGSEHVVAAADVSLPEAAPGSRYVAAYRRWLGLEQLAPGAAPARRRPHKATASDVDLTGPVELVVLSVKENSARCRLVASERVLTLRATGLWNVVPGEIAVVQPGRQWSYAGHPYLGGEVVSSRLDVAALRLVPLALHERGTWNPVEQYWGEDGAPIDEWARSIIARGPRPEFEMEQIVPGVDPQRWDTDPISESVDLADAGDRDGARARLMKLCGAELRCLDAHAHLGNLVFDHAPEKALRHYEAGVRIGELSLPSPFEGLLPWGWIDNRPFLRCMHGYGLCLWRLARFDEAQAVFERMLWLNPSDNQGIRALAADVRAHLRWEDQSGG